jgi:hypothetical protein
VTTAADALSTSELAHHEVLRIERDFGKPDFQIVVDAWEQTSRDSLADVRLWWVRPSRDDERHPFSLRLMRYLQLSFEPKSDDRWHVGMVGDRKHFEFSVELESDGRAVAYGDVITEDGRTIRHCRTTHGHLVARRFLGVPVGIKQLEVNCVDQAGQRHAGVMQYEKTARGRLYKE